MTNMRPEAAPDGAARDSICNETEKPEMTGADADKASSDRDLVLTRLIDAPREKLFRAWTDPEWLKQWFAPLPFTTPVAELDLRAGGANYFVMRGPDGAEMPNRGVYLEVIPNTRIVFTNAYSKA